MTNLIFRIKISGTYYELSPIFNDFKLKKVRDKKNILRFNFVSDSEITLKNTLFSTYNHDLVGDYDRCKSFVGKSIEGFLIETINGLSASYPIFFEFSNEFDEDFETLTAKIIIKDKYFYFDKSLNSVFSKTLGTGRSIEKFVSYQTGIFSDYVYQLYLGFSNSYGGQYLIDKPKFTVVEKIGVDAFLLTLGTYKYSYDVELKEVTKQQILEHFLEFLRIGYFIYFDEIENNYYIDLDFLNKDFETWFVLDTTKQKFIKKYKLLTENKIYIEKFTTFSSEDYPYSELNRFSNLEIDFENYTAPEVENTASLESCFTLAKYTSSYNLSKVGIIAGEKYPVNEWIPTAEFSRQYQNDTTYPFTYVSGNLDSFGLKCAGVGLMHFWVGEGLNFQFIRLYISIEVPTIAGYNISGGQYVSIINNGVEYKLNQGDNIIEFDYYNGTFASSDVMFFSGITFSDIKTFHCQVYMRSSYSIGTEFWRAKDFTNDVLSIKNVLEYHSYELAENRGRITQAGGHNYYDFEKRNDLQRIISGVDYDNTFDTIPDFCNVDIDGEIERVDEVQRTYSNNHYSRLQLITTKKA